MDNVAARQDIIHPSVYYTTKAHVRICQIITSSRYTSKLYDALIWYKWISREKLAETFSIPKDAYKWEINRAYKSAINVPNRSIYDSGNFANFKNEDDTQF